MKTEISTRNEIEQLRNRLNQLMESNTDYEQIYSLSLELDKLIYKYSTLKSR